MLQYKNSKTNSLIQIPELTLKDVNDYTYLIKIMIYNDERLIKNKMQKLANCLSQVKRLKED